MAIHEQAPILLKNGIKERYGLFAYRPHELEQAICCCLGSRDTVPIKVMLFLTGNSNDGDFRVVQKTIYDRMKISEKRYYDARKTLQEMGWIKYDNIKNVIYVNYDKIYADYEDYQKKNKAGGHHESLKTSSTKDRAVVKELAEQSSNEQVDCCDETQWDYHKDRYNNINNNISNTINKKISGGAGCPGGQPPPEELIKQMKEEDQKILDWCQIELKRINKKFGYPIEPFEMKRMHESEDFKQYLEELDKRRIPLRQKYGKLYEW